MPRKVAIGIVTSDKMNKTRRVEIPRLVAHPKYGKYMRRRTICYVHDEQNQSHVGDWVEIIESRPLSRLKRWKLVQEQEQAITQRPVGSSGGGSAEPSQKTPSENPPTTGPADSSAASQQEEGSR
jgi:small subunit ribosomal protein S17